MFLINLLLKFAPWLVMFSLVVILEARLSLLECGAIYMSVIALATLAGVLLLRSSKVGQASWRNVFATRLLPFSGILGYGSLLKLCVSNLLGSILFGLACFFVLRYLRHNDYDIERIGGWTVACWPAWIVLTWMVLLLLRQYSKRYYTGASGFRMFLKLISVPAFCLASSIALQIEGFPLIAFFIAMIPVLIVFVSMGPMLIVALIANLSGKPFRWN